MFLTFQYISMLKGTMMYYLVDIASRVYTKKFKKKMVIYFKYDTM